MKEANPDCGQEGTKAMPRDQAGSLPLALTPTPFPGETVASFAARIDASTGAKSGHLWGIATSLSRIRDGLPARQPVPGDPLELAVRDLCCEVVGEQANSLLLLGKRPAMTWHACQLCTGGAVIELHPASARLVCPKHRVWTGPARAGRTRRLRAIPPPAANHSNPVNDRVVHASAMLYASGAPADLLWDVLRRAASAARREWNGIPQPSDLPLAAAILETATDQDIIRAASNPHASYPALYDRVAARMATAGNPAGSAGVDEAWLLLRWTAAAARHRRAGEWNTEDPEPLIRPVDPTAAPEPAALQPFHTFLDCLHTVGRDDECWWEDRYTQFASGQRNMCPAGHVLERRPSKDHRHPPYDASCALCSGHRVVAGYNSLADLRPDLSREWDPGAPHGPTPWTAGPGCNKPAHWICPIGHRYAARFANRALRGSGCPHCAVGKILPGTTDLATTHPELARLWDPHVGNPKTPTQLSAGNASDRITWRCPRGHQFMRTPAKLVQTGGRCQFCNGKILIPGVNDLATVRPDLAAQWHPYLNGNLTPADVKPGSEMTVWWQCPHGHEFLAQIDHRNRYPKLTCPIESGRVLLVGASDLATREPLLVRDWDTDLNGCRPCDVVPGNVKRWWTCRFGHTQHTLVVNRRRSGGCTECPPAQRVTAHPVSSPDRRPEAEAPTAGTGPAIIPT